MVARGWAAQTARLQGLPLPRSPDVLPLQIWPSSTHNHKSPVTCTNTLDSGNATVPQTGETEGHLGDAVSHLCTQGLHDILSLSPSSTAPPTPS